MGKSAWMRRDVLLSTVWRGGILKYVQRRLQKPHYLPGVSCMKAQLPFNFSATRRDWRLSYRPSLLKRAPPPRIRRSTEYSTNHSVSVDYRGVSMGTWPQSDALPPFVTPTRCTVYVKFLSTIYLLW